MEEGFLRQRRNLMLLSGFLLLFRFADLEIEKMSILGTQLLVGRPDALRFSAWILWGYFFLRYFQYFRSEESKGLICIINEKTEYFSSQFVKDKVKKGSNDRLNLKKKSFLSWSYKLEYFDPTKGRPYEGEEIPMPFFYMIIWRTRSVWHSIVEHTYFTDYIFPILVAFSALIFSIA